MKELFSALIKAQSEMGAASKDAKNPHLNKKYADFNSVAEACRDALHRNGLTFVQPTRIHESGITVVVTRILHSSGQMIEGEYPVIAKDMTDPQKHGGGLTYARRYALASMLGIVQEDDDGITAASAPKAPAAAPAPAAKQGPASIFAAHKLEYPQALEQLIGKQLKEWNDADKVVARQAVNALTEGKPWSEIIKNNVFQ